MLRVNFMDLALDEAKLAAQNDEVPVGTVIVYKGEVVASAHNKMESEATAHAEMIAIKRAAKRMQKKKLVNCDMYVTLEPCAMCMQAILLARINKLYFGAYSTFFAKNKDTYLEIYGGLQKESCEFLLKEFFNHKRKKS